MVLFITSLITTNFLILILLLLVLNEVINKTIQIIFSYNLYPLFLNFAFLACINCLSFLIFTNLCYTYLNTFLSFASNSPTISLISSSQPPQYKIVVFPKAMCFCNILIEHCCICVSIYHHLNLVMF